jgi:hypothetical protein
MGKSNETHSFSYPCVNRYVVIFSISCFGSSLKERLTIDDCLHY